MRVVLIKILAQNLIIHLAGPINFNASRAHTHTTNVLSTYIHTYTNKAACGEGHIWRVYLCGLSIAQHARTVDIIYGSQL